MNKNNHTTQTIETKQMNRNDYITQSIINTAEMFNSEERIIIHKFITELTKLHICTLGTPESTDIIKGLLFGDDQETLLDFLTVFRTQVEHVNGVNLVKYVKSIYSTLSESKRTLTTNFVDLLKSDEIVNKVNKQTDDKLYLTIVFTRIFSIKFINELEVSN